jgi:protein PhnA
VPMSNVPPCPKCGMENTYPDGANYVCADCAHEWPIAAPAAAATAEDVARAVKDAHGTVLVDGDAVILIKDLKLRGSSQSLKGGTKIRNIRLVDGDHEIDCKVDGVGMMLKACYVKKAA